MPPPRRTRVPASLRVEGDRVRKRERGRKERDLGMEKVELGSVPRIRSPPVK